MALEDEWFMTELECQDNGKKAVVTAKWRKYGKWELVEV